MKGSTYQMKGKLFDVKNTTMFQTLKSTRIDVINE